MAGIKITRGRNVLISNVTFINMDVGVEAVDSDIITENLAFTDVREPFKISGGSANVSRTKIFQSTGTDLRVRSKRSAEGHTLPAKCNDCGSVFASSRYNVMNARFLGGKHNQEVCPVCRSTNAFVALGIFDVALTAASLVAGPEASQALLQALRSYSAAVSLPRTSPPSEVYRLEAVVKSEIIEALTQRGKVISPTNMMAIFGFLCLFWPSLPSQILASVQDVATAAMDYILDQFIDQIDDQDVQRPGNVADGDGLTLKI